VIPGKILLTLATLLLAAPGVAADSPLRTFGDVRIAGYASERDARDRTETSEQGLRMRLRMGAELPLTTDWLLRGRLATRQTTDQDGTRFWRKAWTPTRTGLEDGDAAIDELYLRWAPTDGNWMLRIGRFQSSFTLADIAGKSLDRKDSSNMAITWTDGLHLRYHHASGWRSHLILQHNAREGASVTARAPLSFDDSDSRVSTFAGLESTARWGPLTQRMLSVTWMPKALATESLDAPRRDDYLAVTARATAEWPIGPNGMLGVLGGEVGYAPNTPDNVVMDSGTSGRAEGMATQFSMNLLDFAPRHDIGFVYGELDPGWLISPSFRPNDLLLEIRYRWRMTATWTMEARLRRREERHLPPEVTRPRIDDDFYLRFARRF
jgi:hypothetical protein